MLNTSAVAPDLFAPLDSSAIAQSEFYKQGLRLPDHGTAMQEHLLTIGDDIWIVSGMLVLFCILAVIIHNRHTVLWLRMTKIFSQKRHYFEDVPTTAAHTPVYNFLLTSIATLSLSVIFLNNLTHINDFVGSCPIPYWFFAVAYAVCMLFILSKALLYRLVNWVFFDYEQNENWMSAYFLITALTAFILYPLAMVDLFVTNAQHVVSTCVILVGITYEIMLFYKLFVNFKTKKHGYMTLFLYFCSVELIPIIFLWHITGWLSDNILIKNILF